MSDLVSQIGSKIYTEYIAHNDITNLSINELVILVMAEIGKIQDLAGLEKKAVAVQIIHYLLDNSYLNLTEDAKALLKTSLPSLIDTIYQIHNGTIDHGETWDKVKKKVEDEVKEIGEHLLKRFHDLGELTYTDTLQIVSYAVEMVNRYRYLSNEEKKNIVLNVLIEFLNKFTVDPESVTPVALGNLIELVLEIGKGNYTITGESVSFFKRIMRVLRCM